MIYDAQCRACPRLASFLDTVKYQYPHYFCKPVPPFGSQPARLLIVGLAPGMHGANASGRPFTGDWCSDLLYGTLHRFGFATQPQSLAADDQQTLIDCRLTNAVKCLPPFNKPTPLEIATCAKFLKAEIDTLGPDIIVCLGAVAHDAVLRCLDIKTLGIKRTEVKFGHAAVHRVGRFTLVDSYHPSRYNTNTGRLTQAMFETVFSNIRAMLDV
jgi:uracil-DNA glycosylase family 4